MKAKSYLNKGHDAQETTSLCKYLPLIMFDREMDRERRQRSHCLFYINVISKVIIEERVNEFTFGWQWGKPLGGLKKSVHDATCVCLNM